MLSAMFEGQASWMAQPAPLVPQAGVQSLGGSPITGLCSLPLTNPR